LALRRERIDRQGELESNGESLSAGGRESPQAPPLLERVERSHFHDNGWAKGDSGPLA
jgi:hypothetical protein